MGLNHKFITDLLYNQVLISLYIEKLTLEPLSFVELHTIVLFSLFSYINLS